MTAPAPEDVREELERLCMYRYFRGTKLRRLLRFLVEEWLRDGGAKLTGQYIAETSEGEPLTFEEAQKWGYPKTRANLMAVRKRLRRYYETQGYRDPVIIKLNPGSYVPVIDYNPVSTALPELDPHVERLILRAKTALDARTVRGAWRAVEYYDRIPLNPENARQSANILFLPMACGAVIPSIPASIRPFMPGVISRIKATGTEPWESVFAEACGKACYQHNWPEALRLFEVAVTGSQGEAKYFWWYTALLTSLGRLEEAIDILESAVRHFSRTNIATRTDLALLQVMAARFGDAEETLSASLDFTAPGNPILAFSFSILYEAQDRLIEAARVLIEWFNNARPAPEPVPLKERIEHRDAHALLNGMFTLVAGRAGATSIAVECAETLQKRKAEFDKASSLEIALGLIGLGRFDAAVGALRRASLQECDPLAMWFHLFPPLRHLRNERNFQELLAMLNLPHGRRA